MAIPQVIQHHYTPAEYLALERKAEYKSEYADGYIYAMNGGTPDHSRVKFDLARHVGNQLEGSRCEAFDSDLMVRVDPGRYTYPDLTVVCGESAFEDDMLLNPTAIFEVLSPTTEAGDRGEKWGRYRRMRSLQQYVLVSQDKSQIEVYTRQGDVWTFRDASGPDASIDLESIGCTLALGEVYAWIAFDRRENAEPGGTSDPPGA